MQAEQETITVNKQALIEAVTTLEQRIALQQLILERHLTCFESLAQTCRETLCGYGVMEAKGALLSLLLSDMEWDDQLRQALFGSQTSLSLFNDLHPARQKDSCGS